MRNIPVAGPILVALAIALGVPAAARTNQPAAATVQSDPRAAARTAIRRAMAADQIPAMAVAVYQEGRLIWSEAFGMADLEHNVPARTDSLFRIGSVAKVLTATLAVRLAEQGLVDLDRPIRDYLSEWPERHPPITLRQLLGHLGGIRHYVPRDFDASQPGGRNDLRLYPDRASILSLFAGDDLVARPGERFHYSTFGYTLAGLVLEAATGRDYMALLREHVLSPGGIEDIQLDDFFAVVPRRVENYDATEDYRGMVAPSAGAVVNAVPLNSAYKVPGGGLVGSAPALARFGALHFAPGFVGEAMYRDLFTVQQTGAGEATGTGLGWRIGVDESGRRIFHHSGSQQGSRAHILVYPEQRLSVAILSNLGNRPRDIAALAHVIAPSFLARGSDPRH